MGRELEVKNYDTDKRTHAYYHLFAVRPVEAFDEGVLIGLAGLNVAEADPLRRTPLDEGFGNELGAIVDAHPSRAAIEPHELVQHPNTRALGMEVPISIASASRLPSSMTVRARKGRPAYRASTMKSRAHVSFRSSGAKSGCRRRTGTRRFVRRGKLRRSAQYTRCTRLWFQQCPARRRR